MKAFQQNIGKLEAANTQVLGVSMDSPFANFNFAQQNGVTFPLIERPGRRGHQRIRPGERVSRGER